MKNRATFPQSFLCAVVFLASCTVQDREAIPDSRGRKGSSPSLETAPTREIEPSSAKTPAEVNAEGIRVDRARGEVVFPCKFVNPSRLLEVFACHEQGPVHETVVAFSASGTSLYRALQEIGLRSASYWNGTSPQDFLENQGDKVLVSVRWKDGGQVREMPAEALLLDGPSGYPCFVRGFSVSARGYALPETTEPAANKDSQFPLVVEITLGASNRQSPSYSLLVHPTNLPRMLPWMLPPELDERTIGDHKRLVEEGVLAELAIRKVSSESELLEFARSADRARGLDERAAVYEAWFPIAAEIDRLKAEYECLLAEAKALMGSGEPEELPEAERRARGERALELLRRGRWLSARIEERYLHLYALQEELKAAWVEKREDVSPEIREEAIVLARCGFAYEPKLAALRAALAAVELPESGYAPGERKLRRDVIERELQILELERQEKLAEANLRHVRRRIAALEPSDTYLAELFGEDVRHFEAVIRASKAKRRIARTEIAELTAALEGDWEAKQAEVLAERARAQTELQVAEAEEQLNSVLMEIRYAKNDLASDIPDRQASARKRLEENLEKKKMLEERIQELRSALER